MKGDVAMGLFNFFKKRSSKNIENNREDSSAPSSLKLNFSVQKKTVSIPSKDVNNCDTTFSNVNFLKWINGKVLPSDNSIYPRYMQYRYSITQPLQKHRQMILDGFLTEGNISDSLKKLKVPDLKNILSEHNLHVTGKKDILIQRIIDNVDCSTLNIPKVFILTEKGENYLNKYYYYVEFNDYISRNILELSDLSNFDSIKNKNPHLHTNDIVWNILQSKYFEYIKEQDYGLIRNIELSRYYILEKEDKKKDAAYHLLIVFYYDLSGMNNNGIISRYSDLFISQSLIQDLRVLKDFIDNDMIHKIYQRIDVPFHYFNENTFSEIIFNLLNDDVDLNNYLAKSNTVHL